MGFLLGYGRLKFARQNLSRLRLQQIMVNSEYHRVQKQNSEYLKGLEYGLQSTKNMNNLAAQQDIAAYRAQLDTQQLDTSTKQSMLNSYTGEVIARRDQANMNADTQYDLAKQDYENSEIYQQERYLQTYSDQLREDVKAEEKNLEDARKYAKEEAAKAFEFGGGQQA